MLKATFLYQIKLSYGKVGVVQLISLKQNNRVSDKIVRKMINVLCQQTSSEEKNQEEIIYSSRHLYLIY